MKILMNAARKNPPCAKAMSVCEGGGMSTERKLGDDLHFSQYSIPNTQYEFLARTDFVASSCHISSALVRSSSLPATKNKIHFALRIALYSILLSLLSSCEQDLPPNPYDNISDPVDTSQVQTVDPNSFAGIHKNILKPTCANSGCHDGTFEPDYRTIESAYNTLVFHPVIKNDTNGTYRFRVMPGDTNLSILYVRLTQDLNGNSGKMPLLVNPGSDWLVKKDEYIQNIANWINAGAKDILGNAPVRSNKRPQMLGVVAAPAGTTAFLERYPNGSLKVPLGMSSIDVWFALSDDSTSAAALSNNKIKFSLYMNDFATAQERSLQILSSPLQADGYEGNPVSYYHKITINPYDFGIAGNNVFMRVYVKDPQNDITEIPSKYSESIFKTYFTLVLEK